jgi:hypothetical protein
VLTSKTYKFTTFNYSINFFCQKGSHYLIKPLGPTTIVVKGKLKTKFSLSSKYQLIFERKKIEKIKMKNIEIYKITRNEKKKAPKGLVCWRCGARRALGVSIKITVRDCCEILLNNPFIKQKTIFFFYNRLMLFVKELHQKKR